MEANLANKKMQLFIYTKKPHNYFSKEFIKEVGRFVFRKKRGPQMVIDSLIRGLSELGEDFSLNNKKPKLDGTETFLINSSIDALKWAIKLKKEGRIKNLIAAPNLVVLPHYNDFIINSKEIDIFLLPSDWTRRMWDKFGFKFDEKIRIWPSGVVDDGIINEAENEKRILLYKKYISNDIYLMVKKVLNDLKLDYREIVYGDFSRKQYFELLDKSSFVIYLQKSESQGIGLLESWMKNIPTLVFNTGFLEIEGQKIIGDDIAAPFLNNESGSLFKTEDELKEIINKLNFGEIVYHPRNYFLNNFTDKICANNLINIIKEIK